MIALSILIEPPESHPDKGSVFQSRRAAFCSLWGRKYFVNMCISDSTCQSFVGLLLRAIVNVWALAATSRMEPQILLKRIIGYDVGLNISLRISFIL